MSSHSFIPHRLFVAALSGARKIRTPPPGQPSRIFVETDALVAADSHEERLQREGDSTVALRRVLSLGTGAEI